MTRDEVFQLIRSAVDSRLSFPGMPEDEWDDVADAVLRAIRAAGLVVAEPIAQSGHIALVRVVPNE